VPEHHFPIVFRGEDIRSSIVVIISDGDGSGIVVGYGGHLLEKVLCFSRTSAQQAGANEEEEHSGRTTGRGSCHDRSLLTKVRKWVTEQITEATIPEKWTVSPIGYENANPVPKRKSAAGE